MFIGRFIRCWPMSSVVEVGIAKEYLQLCFIGPTAVPHSSAILDRAGARAKPGSICGFLRLIRQDLKLLIGLILRHPAGQIYSGYRGSIESVVAVSLL